MAHWSRPFASVGRVRVPPPSKMLLAAGAIIAVSLLSSTERAHWLLPTAHAQESGQWVVGQVVKLDTASKRLTIRAIMGFQELRARKGELLENVKVGDQVRLQVGPDGTEKVITALEVIR